MDNGKANLWTLDFARNTATRLTFGESDRDPIWSPDGSQIVFRSFRDGKSGQYRMLADGSKGEGRLLTIDTTAHPTSWSHDGRFLLYDVRDPKSGMDMWILSLADGKTRLLQGGEFDEGEGVFSPDGHWIAYLSNESGREEVYVKAFLANGSVEGKWMVSRGALAWKPHWRPDSRELDYVGAGASLMSVAIAGGPKLQAGPPVAYGKAPIGTFGDISPDGKRVLAPLPIAQEEPSPFTIVLHWQTGLGKSDRTR
jgi:Tol biopolymer transport system component